MRPAVEGYDAVRVIFIPDEHDRSGRLNNLERRNDGVKPRDAGQQTAVLRVDLLGLRRVIVGVALLLLSRRRPRLIRKKTIGRIDNTAGDTQLHSAYPPFEVRAATDRIS